MHFLFTVGIQCRHDLTKLRTSALNSYQWKQVQIKFFVVFAEQWPLRALCTMTEKMLQIFRLVRYPGGHRAGHVHSAMLQGDQEWPWRGVGWWNRRERMLSSPQTVFRRWWRKEPGGNNTTKKSLRRLTANEILPCVAVAWAVGAGANVYLTP